MHIDSLECAITRLLHQSEYASPYFTDGEVNGRDDSETGVSTTHLSSPARGSNDWHVLPVHTRSDRKFCNPISEHIIIEAQITNRRRCAE